MNKLYQLKLFTNILIAMIYVIATEAERPFSKLEQIKSVQQSVAKQDRLIGLGTLAIESDLAKVYYK